MIYASESENPGIFELGGASGHLSQSDGFMAREVTWPRTTLGTQVGKTVPSGPPHLHDSYQDTTRHTSVTALTGITDSSEIKLSDGFNFKKSDESYDVR